MTKPRLDPESVSCLFRGLLIVGAVVWIYSPVFRGDWIWDDSSYLSAHLHLNNPGWWRTWFEAGLVADYYPIESTVLLTQWHLWHEDTLGYHLTHVLLHIMSALLVWRLLNQLAFGSRGWVD